MQEVMGSSPFTSTTETTISKGIVVFCWYGYQPENQSAMDTLLNVKRTGQYPRLRTVQTVKPQLNSVHAGLSNFESYIDYG